MSYTSQVMAFSPNAYFLFDETTGTPLDSSGNGRDITVVDGAANITYRQVGPITSDPSNYAIRFAGAAGFARGVGSFATTNVFTLMCWIKRTRSGPVEETLITQTDNGPGLYLESDAMALAEEGVAILQTSTTTITDTNWHFLVQTKSGAVAKQYIDAVDRSGTLTDFTFGTPAVTGTLAEESGTVATYQGYMARPAVLPVALSLAQVQSLYAAATTATSASDDPPIGFLGRGAGW